MEVKAGPIFQKNWESEKRIVINRGGTRSGKTYSLCQLACNWLLTGQLRKGMPIDESGVFQVVRKYRSTIRSSVLRDFEQVVTDFGVWNKLKVHRNDLTFKFYTGEDQYRMVEFIGADDQQKLRGAKRTHLYMNEAMN
jgi:phage terminase large subunit